jgi:opacity protein-like surface antigen
MKRMRELLPRTLALIAAMAFVARGVRAEAFIDLYAGAALNADSDVALDLKEGAGFVDEVRWDNSFAPGGRGGYWLNALPWLGFALDASYFEAEQSVEPIDNRILELRSIPISGLAMVRYPLRVDSDFPHGRFYPYAAIGPAVFLTEMKARLGESGFLENFKDSQTDVGLDLRVGAKLHYPVKSWGAFAEYRFTYFEPTRFKDDVGGVPITIQPNRLLTHYLIFGLGYHF